MIQRHPIATMVLVSSLLSAVGCRNRDTEESEDIDLHLDGPAPPRPERSPSPKPVQLAEPAALAKQDVITFLKTNGFEVSRASDDRIRGRRSAEELIFEHESPSKPLCVTWRPAANQGWRDGVALVTGAAPPPSTNPSPGTPGCTVRSSGSLSCKYAFPTASGGNAATEIKIDRAGGGKVVEVYFGDCEL